MILSANCIPSPPSQLPLSLSSGWARPFTGMHLPRSSQFSASTSLPPMTCTPDFLCVCSCRYVLPLTKALEYCHNKDVLWRNLKMENLLLDHEGRLKIADFGISVRSPTQPPPPWAPLPPSRSQPVMLAFSTNPTVGLQCPAVCMYIRSAPHHTRFNTTALLYPQNLDQARLYNSPTWFLAKIGDGN